MAGGELVIRRNDSPANGGKAQRRDWPLYEVIYILHRRERKGKLTVQDGVGLL
jgi:hypothetical protein